ncbi:MAG: PHP domain-containing protein [Methanobacteriaceae archaeon]|nr:PHP domain-containing protein [Methanobacteriaceae archaeon]
MKIDTHIHSNYSYDSAAKLEDIIKYSKNIGLKAIAITDHDNINGTNKIKEMDHEDLIIIPGEEISSKSGHVIALGIQEHIKALQTTPETIDQIHEQGGIAIAAHPYCLYRSGMGKIVEEVNIDAIETMNSRFIFGISNYRAKKLSKKKNIPAIGASDAHFIKGIGSCYTQIPNADNVDEILNHIKKGNSSAHGVRTPFQLIIKETIRKRGRKTKPKVE